MISNGFSTFNIMRFCFHPHEAYAMCLEMCRGKVIFFFLGLLWGVYRLFEKYRYLSRNLHKVLLDE